MGPPLRLTASTGVAGTSGGAIFHAGSARVLNTSFVANEAGIEGPGVMSVGFVEDLVLSNVSSAENMFYGRTGQ